MKERTPSVAAVTRLLDACGLPSADIDEALLREFVALEDEGRLVATGGLELYPPVALLRSVAVAPATRGKGIAATLVRALEERAFRRGATWVYLITTDADGYFRRLGYAAVARDEVPAAIRETEQFSSLCPGDATVMLKELD
ncbi:MAG: GNAT family N-acetyltransferase [bacterium]|nr:GNAT family N-acetyltransferase [bacterium]